MLANVSSSIIRFQLREFTSILHGEFVAQSWHGYHWRNHCNL
jgi:hypothetical protein